MRILLDTCTFLWLTTNASELSDQARSLFQNTENQVYLSCISVWEIVVKNKLGKLPIPGDPIGFVCEQCKNHQITFLDLNEKAIFQLFSLPDLHRDPFDRMLICQAIENKLVILTPDEFIKQYPVDSIW